MFAEQKNRRLTSLFALSTAAVAATVAQSASATVVVTNVNQSVGFAANDTDLSTLPLPSGANIVIGVQTSQAEFHTLLIGGSLASHVVDANFQVKTQQISGYGFVRPLNAGVQFATAPAGAADLALLQLDLTNRDRGPATFADQYFSFTFDNAGTTDFGWIEGSLTDTSFANMTYTVSRFAYDDTGAPLATGQTTAVPEPGLALAGLLVTGAAGVRRHKRRPAAAAV